MQKKDKPSYKSEKVLGKIFREIDKADYKNYQSTLTQETVYDTRMIVPDMELYIAEARTLKTQYNRQLYAHMNHYGIQTEAEVCSGFIIKWLKSGKNKSKYEQHDYAMKVINNFKSTWKKRFEQEFLDASKTIDKSRKHYIDAKAAAWYYVAYHPDERMKDMSVEGGFFSFPWCVYEYICDVAKRNKPKEKVNYPTIDEESIKEGIKKLAILRNDAAVIDDDEEDDMFDDEDDHDYDTLDESSDDEVIIAPTPGRSSIHRVLSAAGKPVISQANSGNRGSQDKTASQTLTSTSASRQTVLHADATEEDIVAALLGNTSM
ncbi:hypothetical protein BDF20DRAFT_872429 [Mycotypha africana]|uniref:uncharacterized protein n=1 Tax=Mycotypha africana TaxID=64632 RepID=UPI0023005786|nr:uncharacterized protein BDF20DRAFT_872429 [Mycotypha africana]KAI8977018.1 hypothetical protein BDF20DRAFT_872429 [Mycotypha africana]